MKPSIIAAAIALISITGQASAACSGNSLNQTQLGNLLTGNTVCVPAVMVDPMTWQELHVAGGALVDYKRGPGHAVDPSEQVGTWSISGTGNNATVIHNYGTGGSYQYTVYPNGANYSFCSAGPEIVARVKTGGGAC